MCLSRKKNLNGTNKYDIIEKQEYNDYAVNLKQFNKLSTIIILWITLHQKKFTIMMTDNYIKLKLYAVS